MSKVFRALAFAATLSVLGACRAPISSGSGGDTDLSLAFIIQGRAKTAVRKAGGRLILPTVTTLTVVLEGEDRSRTYESSAAVDDSQTVVDIEFEEIPVGTYTVTATAHDAAGAAAFRQTATVTIDEGTQSIILNLVPVDASILDSIATSAKGTLPAGGSASWTVDEAARGSDSFKVLAAVDPDLLLFAQTADGTLISAEEALPFARYPQGDIAFLTLYNPTEVSRDYAVVINRPDIAVVGIVGTAEGTRSRFWKNGVSMSAYEAGSTSFCSSVVDGGNDYVGGQDFSNGWGWEGILMVNGTKRSPNLLSVLGHQQMSDFDLVDGIDYLCGNDRDLSGEADNAVFWKAGVRKELTSYAAGSGIFAYTYGLAVSGSSVYVVGADQGTCCVWRSIDGGATFGKINITTMVALKDVTIVDGTIYAAGSDEAGYPAYASSTDGLTWTTTTLAGGTATVESIFVSGGDVYASGSDGSSALLWVNGDAPVALSGGMAANSVVVDGAVYVAGMSISRTEALLWVDGIPLVLETGTPDTFASDLHLY